MLLWVCHTSLLYFCIFDEPMDLSIFFLNIHFWRSCRVVSTVKIVKMPFYRVCQCSDEEINNSANSVDSDLDWNNSCSHYMFTSIPILLQVWTLRLLIWRPPMRIDRFGIKTTIPMSELEVGLHESIHTMSGTKEDIIKNLKTLLPYPTANDMSNSVQSTDMMCEVRVLWGDQSRGPMIGPHGSHIERIRREKSVKVEIHNRNCPGQPKENEETLSSEFLMLLSGSKAMVIEALTYYYEVNAQYDCVPLEKRFSAKNGHARADQPYGGYGLEGFCNPRSISNSSWRRLTLNCRYRLLIFLFFTSNISIFVCS